MKRGLLKSLRIDDNVPESSLSFVVLSQVVALDVMAPFFFLTLLLPANYIDRGKWIGGRGGGSQLLFGVALG